MARYVKLHYWLGLWLLSISGLLHRQMQQPHSAQTQSTPSANSADTKPKSDPERQRAIELFNAGNFVDAMPLFEKLAADHPDDATIKENWAFSIAAHAATLPDAELRKKARIRARAIALQAQKQGDNSAAVQRLLLIPVDGSEAAFSDRKDVDDAMKAAEADFAHGDLDKARTGYLRTLLLDPNNYYAALFIGDVYFKQHVNGSAGEWFAHAAEIDPNRETAYRYWGDALLAMGKSADARVKYIDAVVAEPYEKASWGGIQQWAQRANVSLNWVRLQDKAKIVGAGKGPRVSVDPSLHTEDPMFKPWMVYTGRRLQWQQGKFKLQFPNETQYRHTLAEESDALHLMVLALSQPGVSKVDPSLAALVKIDHAGFTEPFALLNRADKEIAQDYAAYRAAHRDTIYRYFDEFVVPKLPQQ
jgi:tetratricopeptide (TPR) repeat protein